jgi:DNA-binding transcriptional ArsR family regulator
MPLEPWKYRRIIENYLDDPDGLAITATLSEGARSAAELAEMTGLPPARIRRYLRQLREEGLVESVRSEARRGAVEHFHFAAGGLMIDEEDLADLSLAQRRKINGFLLKLALTEATRALVTHPLDRNLERVDGTLARIPMQIDEAGWEELAKLHDEFWKRVMETHERIAARLEEEGEQGFRASSVIMLYESGTAE